MGRPTPVGGVDLLAMDVFIEPQGVAARPICEIGRLLNAMSFSGIEDQSGFSSQRFQTDIHLLRLPGRAIEVPFPIKEQCRGDNLVDFGNG